MSPSAATLELIELADLDGLVAHVDRLCAARRWEELVELRDLCRKALERGRQLWPAAAQAEYRLALEAPGRWAGRMLVPGSGRFALGPVPEVAASTHRWDELAPFAPPGPVATVAAHERVVRGEDLTGDARVDPYVLELPLALAPWEPAYPLAEYKAHEALFPLPMASGFDQVDVGAGKVVDDPEATRGLLELASVWTTESNGRAEAVAVVGSAAEALGALGLRTVRLARVTPAEALSLLAWTAASGGAHGRRRGMAAGRFGAWWALAAVAGLLDRWPVPPDELGAAAHELCWYRWDAGGPDTGWVCRVAVEDEAAGLAWALTATDARV
jgi:hypothetical protein